MIEKRNKVRMLAVLAMLVAVTWVGSFCSGVDAKSKYSMDNPAKTYYYDLEYRDISHDGEILPLYIELTAEGRGDFAPDTVYEISLNLPSELRAELQDGLHGIQTEVSYNACLEADGLGLLELKIYVESSGNLYLAWSSFRATDMMWVSPAEPANLGKTELQDALETDVIKIGIVTASTPEEDASFGDSRWHMTKIIE